MNRLITGIQMENQLRNLNIFLNNLAIMTKIKQAHKIAAARDCHILQINECRQYGSVSFKRQIKIQIIE